MEPNESGLLVPPRTGEAGALLGKYSLMVLLGLWPSTRSDAAISPGEAVAVVGPPVAEAAVVFRFLLRSVGVRALVTGFSGLGSSSPAEWFEPPPSVLLESWLWNGMGLWPRPDICKQKGHR